MNIFLIKIIACITMVLDHIKYAIPVTDGFITEYFGRISFPLFAFVATEGYIHTSNLKKYISRLFLFAIISQIPFMFFRTLVGEWKLLNIMFTLLFGIFSILVYDKIKNKYISLPICIFIMLIGNFLNVDYGWFGIASILIMYIFKNRKSTLCFMYILLVLIYYYLTYYSIIKFIDIKSIIFSIIFTIIPIIFIMFYNGKKGRSMKYFFYAFYPIHMLILYFISKFILI